METKLQNELEIETLPLADLQLAIEESINSVKHLSRSQVELREVIKEDPDPEFLLAIKENDYILLNKKGVILQLLTELKIKDATSATTYESSIVALGIELNDLGNSIEYASRGVTEVSSDNMENNASEIVLDAADSDPSQGNGIEDLQMLPSSIDCVHDNRARDGMYL